VGKTRSSLELDLLKNEQNILVKNCLGTNTGTTSVKVKKKYPSLVWEFVFVDVMIRMVCPKVDTKHKMLYAHIELCRLVILCLA
jgi:hypothetical protein